MGRYIEEPLSYLGHVLTFPRGHFRSSPCDRDKPLQVMVISCWYFVCYHNLMQLLGCRPSPTPAALLFSVSSATWQFSYVRLFTRSTQPRPPTVQTWVRQGHIQYRPGRAKATYSTGMGLPGPPIVQAWFWLGRLQYRPGSAWATYSTGLGLPKPSRVQAWVCLGRLQYKPGSA